MGLSAGRMTPTSSAISLKKRPVDDSEGRRRSGSNRLWPLMVGKRSDPIEIDSTIFHRPALDLRRRKPARHIDSRAMRKVTSKMPPHAQPWCRRDSRYARSPLKLAILVVRGWALTSFAPNARLGPLDRQSLEAIDIEASRVETGAWIPFRGHVAGERPFAS